MWSDVREMEVDGEGAVRGRIVGVGAGDVLVVEEVER